jgi:glycosyltransferase involved in cell wall biosynthesis
MGNSPLVSVIMTTFNPNPKYLKESIQSILNQTYKNIEFIIVNDGSKINPKKTVESFRDERIIYIDKEMNQGITKCLNIALNNCKGKYIARMDDDDISLPQRIEKQVSYFQQYSKVNVLGSNINFFGEINKKSQNNLSQLDREIQQIKFLLGNYGVSHPSVMYRASFLKKYNIKYNERYVKAQDYGMWVECSKYTKIDCLEDILLKYRVHYNQISTKGREEQLYFDEMIKLDQVSALGIEPDEQQWKTHLLFCKRDLDINYNDAKKWIRTLIQSNNQKEIYERNLFSRTLKYHLLMICYTGLRKHKRIKFIIPFLRSFGLKQAIQFISDRKIGIMRLIGWNK